ncbi:MAG TPA: hypothetical protein VEH47_08550 [Candidatus Acidoferrales bacterium]|nr:hypothetical protein [Candidatus Acidoferrales bacterium]
MGALTIAFDTIIVGALALPWVSLIVYLFFFKGENRLRDVLNWVRNELGGFGESRIQVVAGVFLFAMAYTLGSAVSRVAQDFFNDDDLYFQSRAGTVRWGTTEDRIIASVFCESDDNGLLSTKAPALAGKIATFRCQKSGACDPDATAPTQATVPSLRGAGALCDRMLSWLGRFRHEEAEDDLIGTARDIFGLEENALLLKGEDATLRLRQLHDQVMVLRGATFNGVVTFAFCVFAWGARNRSEHPLSRWRWFFSLIPAVLVFLAVWALIHHLGERAATEPPYMEFSLAVLGLFGLVLLWPWRRAAKVEQADSVRVHWPGLSLLFFVLSVGGMLGWWSTEVLYAQQVIYSYSSQVAVAGQK